jgi:flagellar basal-body rod protein FlgB
LITGETMPISNIPLFSMLRTRMQWHQERQRLLAENVANADTPGFRPRDLAAPKFGKDLPPAAIPLARTESMHLAGLSGDSARFRADRGGHEIRPTGNAVSLEDEMMKVAANQMDYQAATSLYGRSLGLLKIGIGRG